MMDPASAAGPQAAISFASPWPGRRAHGPLAWDPSDIDFAFFEGGNSAYSTGAFTAGSTQVYKRRRVDTEGSSVQPLFQSVIHPAYGGPETPPYEDAVGHRSFLPASYQDDYWAIAQSAKAPEPSLSSSWNVAERMWCAPCWPTWSGFYAPLAQEPALSDKVETYHDEVSAQTSLVMQQYASPIGPPPPGMISSDLVAEDMLSHQSQLSMIKSPLDSLSESAAHDKDPGDSCRIDTNRQIGPFDNIISGPLSVSCSTFDLAAYDIANGASSHQFGANIKPSARIAFEPSLPPATSLQPTGTRPVFVAANKIKPPGTRGPFKDQALREQTACTRQKGACLECQRQHIRCVMDSTNPHGPCVNCAKMLTSVIPRIPCLRYRMTDVQLSKPGQVPGYEWTRRWHHARKDIKQWASDEVKFIDISEGFSESFMRFQVREFVPKKGDKLERSWVHEGSRKSVPIPPFALVQLEDASKAYDHHMRNKSILNGAMDEILGLSPSLLRRTYQFAESMRQRAGLDPDSKDLLDMTFRLWMVVRLSTRSSWIVGSETLGMSSDLLDTSPDPGKIPLPPVLGAQLDSVLIHDKLGDIRRDLLRRLDRAFRRYKHENWLVTYLVSFTLLHNAALVTAHDARYSRKHGMNRRFAREASVADYHQGAMVILAHFHNCTRNHPFLDRCRDSELHRLSSMTDKEVRFIHDTRVYIKMHEKDWTRIREEGLYEDDFYFVSQLYLDSWEPHEFKVERSDDAYGVGSKIKGAQ